MKGCWYKCTLSPGEKAEVDTYLATHPECLEDIELLKRLQNTTTDDIDIPTPNVSRIMQKLDQVEQANEQPFSHQIRQFLNRLFTPNAAWTAVPVALAIVAVLFLMPSQTNRNGDFQTLSSGEHPAALTISVMTTGDTSALIDEMNKLAPAAIIKTETDDELVVIVQDAIDPEAALKLLQNIQSLPAVKSAELVTSR